MTNHNDHANLSSDVFAAANHFDEYWNSTAKAISHNTIEWQCTTWGSGRGLCDWNETAIFYLIAAAYGLDIGKNREGRDELVVTVPLYRCAAIASLIDRIGEEAEGWPWLHHDEDIDQHQRNHRALATAAEILGTTPDAITANDDLLNALGLA